MNMHKKDIIKNGKVAVWDTYAHRADGSVMHFDIIVPSTSKNQEEIFQYAERFAAKKGETNIRIDATQCQFCHIEEVNDQVRRSIRIQGHYVLEMDDISAKLPAIPSKRDMVFHIKVHHKEFRFTNFSEVPLEVIQKIIENKKAHDE